MKTIDYLDIDKEFLMNNKNDEICVLKNKIDYYFKLNITNKYEKAVIFSNGAVDRSKSDLPVFMRNTWSEEINANCIFVDDRTIHGSRLTIGWGIGREDVHYLNETSEIIKLMLNILNIKNDKSFYYGSSAGGTMSMMLSIKHQHSKAIVNNPQMMTYNYLDGKPLAYLRKKHFSNYTEEEFKENFKERISVPDLIKQKNYLPKCVYILNTESPIDYQKQYLPFIKELNDSGISTKNIEYLLYNNKGLSHNPLSKDRTIKIINAALESVFC